jgi:hypothetical protein
MSSHLDLPQLLGYVLKEKKMQKENGRGGLMMHSMLVSKKTLNSPKCAQNLP